MKIQFLGDQCFSLEDKDVRLLFDPQGTHGQADIVLSTAGLTDTQGTKKTLTLPGEYEVSNVLAKGLYTDAHHKNTAFKIILEDMAVVHFGTLTEIPDTAFFETLGENVDIAILCLSNTFPAKEAKKLLDTLDPRMALFGGDTAQFPALTEFGAKTTEDNPIKITKSNLSDDKTDLIILPL